MSKAYEVNGYELKETYESQTTGLRTIEVPKELLYDIQDFHIDVMKKEEDITKEIRYFKDKGRTFTFKTGVGYDSISIDLLALKDNGKEMFNAYMNYKKYKSKDYLKELNKEIKKYNFVNKTKIKTIKEKADRELER